MSAPPGAPVDRPPPSALQDVGTWSGAGPSDEFPHSLSQTGCRTNSSAEVLVLPPPAARNANRKSRARSPALFRCSQPVVNCQRWSKPCSGTAGLEAAGERERRVAGALSSTEDSGCGLNLQFQ